MASAFVGYGKRLRGLLNSPGDRLSKMIKPFKVNELFKVDKFFSVSRVLGGA